MNVEDETVVVGVDGAELAADRVAVEEALLEPPVISRIENRLPFEGAVAVALVGVVKVDMVEVEDEEGVGDSNVGVAAELGPGDEAVTPATIDDEIL